MEEPVSKFTELISEYGADAVILAIFLVVLAIILKVFITSYQNNIKQMIRDNEAYSKSILKQNESLINKVLEMENDMKKKYREEDIIEIFVKLNKTLKDECVSTLNKTGADRVSIYVFHNGAVASHGLPFFKMSCVCESIKKGSGLVSRMMEHNAIPLNLFDEFIDQLYDNGIYVISSSNENKITAPSHPDIPGFIDRHVFSMTIPIYDSEYRMMGFVIEEHGEPIHGNDQFEEIKAELFKLTEKTSPVLAFSEYHKITTRGGGDNK